MWFLIGQMSVFLVLAALLGVIVGYLLGRIGRRTAGPAASSPADTELQARVDEQQAEIDRLRSELAPHQADDLKEINGIGPVFERTLNAMGYRTYGQLADWSRDDVRAVAAELDLFADRIVRDRWVEQAAELAARGAGAEQEQLGDDVG